MTKASSTMCAELVVALAALAAFLALVAPAAAKKELFFEEQASAFWAVPHECSDGSTVQGTLLVLSTRDFEAPDTEDPDPTARVQFLAVCPDGTSFSWGAPTAPATITSTPNLKSVHAVGSGTARDNLGNAHSVTFDVTWTGFGPIETTVNGPGSKRMQRAGDGDRSGDLRRRRSRERPNPITRPGRLPSSASTQRSKQVHSASRPGSVVGRDAEPAPVGLDRYGPVPVGPVDGQTGRGVQRGQRL